MIKNILLLVLIPGQIFMNQLFGQDNKEQQTNVSAQTLYDQAYGKDAAQKMDIYLPSRINDSTTMMVIVHGGAWVRGDKSEFNPYVAALRQLMPNYAFANINYRLFRSGRNQFPAQEEDMKTAVTYLQKRLSEFGVKRRMVLLGASAGGYLALLQAYKYPGASKPAAVISLFGPTDLTEMYNTAPYPDVRPMLTSLLGASPTDDPKLYKQSSPLEFVDASAPPTLLLQGGQDRLVPENQAHLLHEKLDRLKIVNELKVYPQEGHGWSGPALFDSFARVAAFLKKNVK